MRLSLRNSVGLVAAALLAYRLALADRVAHWGATQEEQDGELPGDELVPQANHQSTRAVEIAAEPAEVWPWLAQMGQGRGGLYSYDWLENLFRLDIHSADGVLPEVQDLAVGDTISLGPSGEGPKVRALEPERLILLESGAPPWTWLFALRPHGRGRTRLVARNRVSTRESSPLERLSYVALGPIVFVMERKMLLGIRERAERLHAQSAAAKPAAVP